MSAPTPESETFGQTAARGVDTFLHTVSKRGVSMHLPEHPEFKWGLIHMARIHAIREGIDFNFVYPPPKYRNAASFVAGMAAGYMKSEGYQIGLFNRRKLSQMAKVAIAQ